MGGAYANSEDPAQMLQKVASNQGLHCSRMLQKVASNQGLHCLLVGTSMLTGFAKYSDSEKIHLQPLKLEMDSTK